MVKNYFSFTLSLSLFVYVVFWRLKCSLSNKVYSLLILTPVASYVGCMYVHSISSMMRHLMCSYLIVTRTVILVQPSFPDTVIK